MPNRHNVQSHWHLIEPPLGRTLRINNDKKRDFSERAGDNSWRDVC